jgi:hypothetical protein
VSSILVTSSAAAFLVVALSGLAASFAPTFSISRQMATFAALRLIGASKATVGDEVVAFYDEELQDRRSAGTGER